jgi:hypothetical protein
VVFHAFLLLFACGNALSRRRSGDEKFKSGLDFLVRRYWTNPRDSTGLRALAQDNLYNLPWLEAEIASHFEPELGLIKDGYFVIDLLA